MEGPPIISQANVRLINQNNDKKVAHVNRLKSARGRTQEVSEPRSDEDKQVHLAPSPPPPDPTKYRHKPVPLDEDEDADVEMMDVILITHW